MRSDGEEGSDAADDGQAPIQAIVNAADAIEYISKTTQGVGVRELARTLRLNGEPGPSQPALLRPPAPG